VLEVVVLELDEWKGRVRWRVEEATLWSERKDEGLRVTSLLHLNRVEMKSRRIELYKYLEWRRLLRLEVLRWRLDLSNERDRMLERRDGRGSCKGAKQIVNQCSLLQAIMTL